MSDDKLAGRVNGMGREVEGESVETVPGGKGRTERPGTEVV
jgi:hypothetical protein